MDEQMWDTPADTPLDPELLETQPKWFVAAEAGASPDSHDSAVAAVAQQEPARVAAPEQPRPSTPSRVAKFFGCRSYRPARALARPRIHPAAPPAQSMPA